jgi:hypothetical protein
LPRNPLTQPVQCGAAPPVFFDLLMHLAYFADCTPDGVSYEPVFCTLKSEVYTLRRVPCFFIRYLLPDRSDTPVFLGCSTGAWLSGLHPQDTDGQGRHCIAASWQSRNLSAVSASANMKT